MLGQTVYASLEEIPHPVDIVDVFRKPSEVPAVAQAPLTSAPRCSGCGLGVENEEAGRMARAAGLDFVEDRA
ncbi:MAG: CoA-binding protein [Thermomicrobiales bacterium]